jgi:3-deoxy-7-phosphoheptulonate synthase
MIIIAGPCSVEGENFIEICDKVKKAGATHLRGGLFKPRSSPFRWHGLGMDVIEFVIEAKKRTGLPFVCEAMSAKQIEVLYPYVDVFQVGARNQTDTELLKEFGKQKKPVLLKRGWATMIDEFIMAADFILNEGNENVILCERGIRTFENYTRNTFDINCIAAVKSICKLPIIGDPSHGTGRRELVIPIAKACIAAGADGVMVEVHTTPETAMTDGEQSITPDMFVNLVRQIKAVSLCL